MKKSFFIALTLVLLAGCTTTVPSTPTPTPTQQPTQTQAPANQTYSNTTYNFEFEYPTEFSFTTPTYGNLKEKIVQLTLPASVYPGTNFIDAAFTVSTASAKSLDECLEMNVPESSKGFETKTTINGTEFHRADGTGAAAGNLYETRTYRTLIAPQRTMPTCLEITQTLHTANIGNYDPGTVTEVDKNKVWQKLKTILDTFEFTE